MSEVEQLRAELEKAQKTLTHIYDLAMTEDGLADFDADSIRDVWERYVHVSEIERVQKQAAAMREALKYLQARLGCGCNHCLCENCKFAYDFALAALQPDVGSDFIRRDSIKPLVDALEYWADARSKNAAWTAITHAKSLGIL